MEFQNEIRECVEEEEQFSIFDSIQDFFMEDLDINQYLDNIQEYHRYMIDKHNMSSTQFDTIVERVRETDYIYGKKIAEYCRQIEAFSRRLGAVCEMIHPEQLQLTPEAYGMQMDSIVQNYRDAKSQINKIDMDAELEVMQKSITTEQLDRWINPEYKLNNDEVEEVRKLLDAYFATGTDAYRLRRTNNANYAMVLRNRMSDEEYLTYQKMIALETKCSKAQSFAMGAMGAVPFLGKIIDSEGKWRLNCEGKTVEESSTFTTIKANSLEQNPLSTQVGDTVMVMAETELAMSAIKGAQVWLKEAKVAESCPNSILSCEEAENIAFDAIHGPDNSDVVVLGKFGDGGPTAYTNVAKDMGAQYFELDNWTEIASQYSEEEIWKINEKFLDIQTSCGREIYLSHNPADYIDKGQFYSKELKYLLDNGYRFVDEGGIWHAIR
jgi:hypothetical protein